MKDFSVNLRRRVRLDGRFNVRLLRPVVLGALLLGGFTLAQTSSSPLTLGPVGGSVEVLEQVWHQAKPAQPISGPLRTGTGRAVVQVAGGQLTLGSSSTMRVYRGQADAQTGRFYVNGQTQLYACGAHLASQGQLRVDASGATQRVAVISGTLRLSPGDGSPAVNLNAGQQYSFRSRKVTAFREVDPWYLSRFVGEGEAVVQASRGSVLSGPDAAHLRGAQIGQVLASGARLKTGPQSWAEVGFSGGGFLRLQADSQLRVLGIEKTDRGREVLLQLESGSAWNVVQKGAGGYQLSTPTVTTAVRGTVFRVDASGLVKVFDGAVSLPSQGDAVVAEGRQRETAGQLAGLKTDALDTFNIALDAERNRGTVLNVPSLDQVTDLRLSVTSNPGARVSVVIGGHDYAVSGRDGAYALQEALPEGRYDLVVRSDRPEQSVALTQALTVDRTAPALTISSVTVVGATFTLSGTVSDRFDPSPLLSAELGGQTYTLHASGAFDWTLPLGTPAADLTTLTVSATDSAGNRSHARLP